MLAYPLSRPNLPWHRGFIFYVVFTLFFNGGLVPTYLVYTQLLGLRNSLLSLIKPNLLLNGFNILILRTFFAMGIPDSLPEAAKIDGAGEWRVLFRFVLLRWRNR